MTKQIYENKKKQGKERKGCVPSFNASIPPTQTKKNKTKKIEMSTSIFHLCVILCVCVCRLQSANVCASIEIYCCVPGYPPHVKLPKSIYTNTHTHAHIVKLKR